MERVSFMVRMLLTVRKRSSPSSDGSDRSLATSASPPPPRASSGPDTLQQARAAPPDEAARADACRGGENCRQEWEGAVGLGIDLSAAVAVQLLLLLFLPGEQWLQSPERCCRADKRGNLLLL